MVSKMRNAESGFWMWADMAWITIVVAIFMIIAAVVLGVDF